MGGRHDVLVVRCASSFPQYLLRVPASLSVSPPRYEFCACCCAIACAPHEFHGLITTYNILTLTFPRLRIFLPLITPFTSSSTSLLWRAATPGPCTCCHYLGR